MVGQQINTSIFLPEVMTNYGKEHNIRMMLILTTLNKSPNRNCLDCLQSQLPSTLIFTTFVAGAAKVDVGACLLRRLLKVDVRSSIWPYFILQHLNVASLPNLNSKTNPIISACMGTKPLLKHTSSLGWTQSSIPIITHILLALKQWKTICMIVS